MKPSAEAIIVFALLLLAGAFACFWFAAGVGRESGVYSERCRNLGGQVLHDGRCGTQSTTYIDAGAR